jgi:hypothetical protein
MPILDGLIAEARQHDQERRRLQAEQQAKEEQIRAEVRIVETQRELQRKFGEDFEAALQSRYDPLPIAVHVCFRYRDRPCNLFAEEHDDGKIYWRVLVELPRVRFVDVAEETDLTITRDNILIAIDELTK